MYMAFYLLLLVITTVNCQNEIGISVKCPEFQDASDQQSTVEQCLQIFEDIVSLMGDYSSKKDNIEKLSEVHAESAKSSHELVTRIVGRVMDVYAEPYDNSVVKIKREVPSQDSPKTSDEQHSIVFGTVRPLKLETDQFNESNARTNQPIVELMSTEDSQSSTDSLTFNDTYLLDQWSKLYYNDSFAQNGNQFQAPSNEIGKNTELVTDFTENPIDVNDSISFKIVETGTHESTSTMDSKYDNFVNLSDTTSENKSRIIEYSSTSGHYQENSNETGTIDTNFTGEPVFNQTNGSEIVEVRENIQEITIITDFTRDPVVIKPNESETVEIKATELMSTLDPRHENNFSNLTDNINEQWNVFDHNESHVPDNSQEKGGIVEMEINFTRNPEVNGQSAFETVEVSTTVITPKHINDSSNFNETNEEDKWSVFYHNGTFVQNPSQVQQTQDNGEETTTLNDNFTRDPMVNELSSFETVEFGTTDITPDHVNESANFNITNEEDKWSAFYHNDTFFQQHQSQVQDNGEETATFDNNFTRNPLANELSSAETVEFRTTDITADHASDSSNFNITNEEDKWTTFYHNNTFVQQHQSQVQDNSEETVTLNNNLTRNPVGSEIISSETLEFSTTNIPQDHANDLSKFNNTNEEDKWSAFYHNDTFEQYKSQVQDASQETGVFDTNFTRNPVVIKPSGLELETNNVSSLVATEFRTTLLATSSPVSNITTYVQEIREKVEKLVLLSPEVIAQFCNKMDNLNLTKRCCAVFHEICKKKVL